MEVKNITEAFARSGNVMCPLIMSTAILSFKVPIIVLYLNTWQEALDFYVCQTLEDAGNASLSEVWSAGLDVFF